MLHVTIRTHHDPRLVGAASSLKTYEGTLEDVLGHIAATVINAKTDGLLDTDGSIEIVIQKSRVKVAGIPGRDK
jgi:hypothetical protein